jgi:hypothetical protein
MRPIIGQLYQHRYGGLYIVDSIATHTENKERLVIYTHLYPFDEDTWARPIEEWTEERFREITGKEYSELTKKDRLEFQIEIGKARAAKV